jgi:hypothetical protein
VYCVYYALHTLTMYHNWVVFAFEVICEGMHDSYWVSVDAVFVVYYLSYGSLGAPFLFVRYGILLGVRHPFDRFLVCLMSLFVAERCALLLCSLLVD